MENGHRAPYASYIMVHTEAVVSDASPSGSQETLTVAHVDAGCPQRLTSQKSSSSVVLQRIQSGTYRAYPNSVVMPRCGNARVF